MSGMASVNLKEEDLSTRVASFEGVFGAIVIPAMKGPETPQLMTSSTQLLNTFTPDGRVDVGFDLSYYSALAYFERANKLWVKRVSNGGTFAGALIEVEGATGLNTQLATDSDLVDPTAQVLAGESLFIHASNVGAWGNKIGIKIITVSDDIKEANAFMIEVYKKGNESTPVEAFMVSRVIGQRDGRGLNMFIEDVLDGSMYIGAINNELVEGDTLPLAQPDILWLNDGDSGLAVTDTNMIAGADSFANANDLSITLLMDGGYSVPSYQKALNLIAEQRQDCVAILSTPYAEQVKADKINALVTYKKETLNLDSSYSALYTPHVQVQDKFNDRKLWISPDGHVASSISFSSNNYEIWYPPAGFKRGKLSTVLDTRIRFSNGEMDVLYNNSINPIRFISGKGIVVWGQKTLQARESALDRLNVRLLLIVIEPAIKEFLENFLFDINDAGNRSVVETMLESYMIGIKARKGVYDFDVKCDNENNTASDIDANRMNVDVYIKPTKSTEEIPVRIVITPSNISFAQASDAV